jgi:hypothetical protein
MTFAVRLRLVAVGWLMTVPAFAAAPLVRAAPSGDATAVASRIIKHSFPSCGVVSEATRRSDGSIHATCDGTDYLVFTVLNEKEGKLLELAMSCAAARRLVNVGC